MKPHKFHLGLMVVIAALSTYGQDSKHRAREFTPKYNMDTFLLNGSPSFIKRKVIRAQELKGIKSAFCDEQSHLLQQAESTFQTQRQFFQKHSCTSP